jgi:hypothetical protein
MHHTINHCLVFVLLLPLPTAAEAEGTLDGLRLRSALRTATGWLLQRNSEQRAWGDAAAAAVATYYFSCKVGQAPLCRAQVDTCAHWFSDDSADARC